MKTIFVIMFILMSFQSIAGEIYKVKNKQEADVVVYVTNIPSEAHIIVYYAKSYERYEARHKDEVWFDSNWVSRSIKVYFTENIKEADVIIAYTMHKSNAGWRKPNKFQMRLH